MTLHLLDLAFVAILAVAFLWRLKVMSDATDRLALAVSDLEASASSIVQALTDARNASDTAAVDAITSRVVAVTGSLNSAVNPTA